MHCGIYEEAGAPIDMPPILSSEDVFKASFRLIRSFRANEDACKHTRNFVFRLRSTGVHAVGWDLAFCVHRCSTAQEILKASQCAATPMVSPWHTPACAWRARASSLLLGNSNWYVHTCITRVQQVKCKPFNCLLFLLCPTAAVS